MWLSALLLLLGISMAESLYDPEVIRLAQQQSGALQPSNYLPKHHRVVCPAKEKDKETLQRGDMKESLSIGSAIASKKEEEVGKKAVCRDDVSASVGEMTWKLLEPRIQGCHFVLMTRDSGQPFASYIIRKTAQDSHPVVVVDFAAKQYNDMFQFPFSIWNSPAINCRALLVDLTAGGDEEMFSFLETSKFHERQDAKVLIVGRRRNARSTITAPAFRNAVSTLYLGLREGVIDRLLSESRRSSAAEEEERRPVSPEGQNSPTGVSGEEEKPDYGDRVSLYAGCLYCDGGRTKVVLKGSWRLGSQIPLKDSELVAGAVKNLQGYLMRITSITFTPYVDYIQSKDGPGGIVEFVDSLDKRLIEAFAPVMNFSFVARSAPDTSFGYRLPNGSWTGVHGAVYRKEADFTTSVGPSAQRMEVVEYERTVSIDQLIIVSLKPQPLPQYLVFLRPFTVGLWMCLFVSIVAWATSLWLLQKARSKFTGESRMSFKSALFYSLAVILQVPPEPPNDVTGQMMVGWWLIACFLITSGFQSSLVAHLAIVGRTEPIDTYRDLVTRKNWKWAIEQQLLTGMVLYYFSQNVDPDVRYIYQLNEKASPEEGLKRVLKGRFSLLITKNRITTIIGQIYKKDVAQTPFYLGRKGYEVASALGWGVRRGAPFRPHLHKLINQMVATGIIDYWVQNVVYMKILRSKAEAAHEAGQGQQLQSQSLVEDELLSAQLDDGKARVLRLVHMMGVFLILILGLVISSLVFCAEKLISRRRRYRRKRPQA